MRGKANNKNDFFLKVSGLTLYTVTSLFLCMIVIMLSIEKKEELLNNLMLILLNCIPLYVAVALYYRRLSLPVLIKAKLTRIYVYSGYILYVAMYFLLTEERVTEKISVAGRIWVDVYTSSIFTIVQYVIALSAIYSLYLLLFPNETNKTSFRYILTVICANIMFFLSPLVVQQNYQFVDQNGFTKHYVSFHQKLIKWKDIKEIDFIPITETQQERRTYKIKTSLHLLMKVKTAGKTYTFKMDDMVYETKTIKQLIKKLNEEEKFYSLYPFSSKAQDFLDYQPVDVRHDINQIWNGFFTL